MSQRVWEYVEPDENWEPVIIRMTDSEILAFYWDWWSGEMRRHRKPGINPDRCIEDWVVVHWAQQVETLPANPKG